jgi:hypothetical protein
VIHPEWVANPILVRKKNNEWRMCVDYTDLNKHCPKDHFGLPRIDQVVNSTASCVLCFLDCYSGYHQIAFSRRRTRSRLRSSPRMGYTLTKLCPSGSKMQEQPTSVRSRCASRISCIGTLRPMWMMWSSRPGIPAI